MDRKDEVGCRVGHEPQKVVETDVDPPPLKQPLSVVGDEEAVDVVGGVLHPGDRVHNAVAVFLVGSGGLAFIGHGQAAGADPGTVPGGHCEVCDLVAALVDLGGGEHGVPLGFDNFSGGVAGEVVRVEGGEAVGIAGIDGAVGPR